MDITPKKITHAGLVLGVAGLVALIFLLPEARFLNPDEITKEKEGQLATVIGTITGLSIAKGNAFFTISGKGNAKAFFYKPSKSQAAILKDGKMIKATGKIAMHNGNPEIILEEVRQLD